MSHALIFDRGALSYNPACKVNPTIGRNWIIMAAEGGGAVNTASMQVSTKVEDAFQVIIIGDSGVGKTSIILRFAKDQFYENTSDAGYVSDFVKEVTVSGRTVKLHVWDTAGLVSTPRSSL